MHLETIMRRGLDGLVRVTGLRLSSVVGMESADDGWQLTVELIEKESIPRAMDILGLYRIRLDPQGEIVGFERTGLRRRSDTPGGA